MIARVLDSPLYPAVLGLLCGMVGFRIGWRLGHRLALPSVQTALGTVAFVAAWRADGAVAATVAVGGWAVGTTAAGLTYFLAEPMRVDHTVLRAAPYRDEMAAWLRSGERFAPLPTLRRHGVELAAYLAAATLTGNVLALALGAVLLNQMNAWVASLLRAARRTAVVALLAWNVWSVARVAAYVVLGAACAAPAARLAGLPVDVREIRTLWIAGGVGVIADIALKLTLSAACGGALARAVDLDRLEPPAGSG